MRVLWLAPYPVWPPTNGGRLRTYHLGSRVAAAGHQVEIWCVSDEQPSLPTRQETNLTFRFFRQRPRVSASSKLASALSMLPTTAWVLRAPKVISALRQRRDFDVAVVGQAQCGGLVSDLSRSGVRWVLDEHNIEWWLTEQISRRLNNPVTRARLRADAIKFKRLEKRLVREAAAVVAVSGEDARRVERMGRAQVAVHPNGVDTTYFALQDHSIARNASILMTGTLGYYPNLDASIWFARDVLPRLQNRLPNATLSLVGGGVTPEVEALNRPESGIDVVGPVDDVRPYLARADVFVIPMRVGSGTRLKALEALSSGLPIVATRLAVEGLGLEERDLVLLGETPEQMAEAIEKALTDRAHRERVATEGRRYVVECLDWDQIGKAFLGTLQQAAG